MAQNSTLSTLVDNLLGGMEQEAIRAQSKAQGLLKVTSPAMSTKPQPASKNSARAAAKASPQKPRSSRSSPKAR